MDPHTRARDLLAANVNALMALRPHLGSNRAVTEAGGPTNGSIDRIRRATHACRLDELDRLAEVFGVEPAELLAADALSGAPPLSREARKLGEDYDAIGDPALRRAVLAMVELVLQGAAPRALSPAPRSPADAPAPTPGAAAPTPRPAPRR